MEPVSTGDGSVSAAFAAPGDTNIDLLVDILDAADFLSTGLFDAGPSSSVSGAIAAEQEPNLLGLVGVHAGIVGLMAARRMRGR
jgi:hypothetical protein